MSAAALRTDRGRPVVAARRRRAFGLDAPRPPDLRRTEAAVRAWLAAQLPDVLALRVEAEEGACAATLVMVLPARRIAVLRIEAGRPGEPPDAGLASACRARRIPLAVVTSVEETRAALRRLGCEPEER